MNDNIKIAAGIVLYNPNNMQRLSECIQSVLNQVGKLYVFDNSTEKISWKCPNNVTYLSEHKNLGIAYALNRIMEEASNDGYEWVVTMDQDSILPDRIIEAYSVAIMNDNSIGIVCPQVIDNRRTYMEIKKEPQKEYVDFCITSASCTSVEAWKTISGFDEWLFVDLVDNEFCKRLILAGYKILRLNGFVLNQEFGQIQPKSERQQKFWIRLSKILHNQNIAKFSYTKYVSPVRVYYTNRNIIYVNRKLKKYGPVGYKDNYNCRNYFGFIISFCLPSLMRAQDKRKVFTAICKGIADGRKVKVDSWINGEN